MDHQRTIAKPVAVKGKGIHSGVGVEVTIYPAKPDQGISFVRVDCNPPVSIPATTENVTAGSGRQTTLGVGDVKLLTVEHLMAVFHGLGIDNATVHVTGSELPGLDGSAKSYVDLIIEAGLTSQSVERLPVVVTEAIYLDEGGSSMTILPNPNGLKISYTLSYQHPDLHDQFFSSTITPEVFERELAPARTFCLKQEAEALLAQGYGRGAGLDNTLVFEKNEPIRNKLRYDNEACRHKVMDLLGDLYLAGHPLRAHVIAHRTGHQHNARMAKKLRELWLTQQKGKSMTKSHPSDQPKRQLDVSEIKAILPHRAPFLLVDRIIDLQEGKKAVGIKNVTVNEDFFRGHFPDHPVMPGVLILEALAQVGGVLMLSRPENQGKLAYFMTIENAKFRQPVHPGDQLRLEAEIIKLRSRTGQCRGQAFVGDRLVCEAEVKFALVDAQ